MPAGDLDLGRYTTIQSGTYAGRSFVEVAHKYPGFATWAAATVTDSRDYLYEFANYCRVRADAIALLAKHGLATEW